MPRYFIKLFSQSVIERNQVLPVAVSQQGEWIFYLCLYLDPKKWCWSRCSYCMELEVCCVLWRSIQKAHSAHSSRSRAGIRGRGLESGDLSLSIK